jgi:endonuclease YncB( thermonuclease family)
MRLPRLFRGNHHRLTLFWALALAGLALPWLSSCEVPVISGGSAERACVVSSVHDGDTLRLTCDGEHVKVRLYCIDAPELSQKPWGQESRDHLRAITPKQVILIPRDKDRYGRTVGELLTADGTRASINLRMVADGLAAVYPKYCNERRFYRAEQRAREDRAGVWAKAGPQQEPWRTRG